jgi:hypothetical protein
MGPQRRKTFRRNDALRTSDLGLEGGQLFDAGPGQSCVLISIMVSVVACAVDGRWYRLGQSFSLAVAQLAMISHDATHPKAQLHQLIVAEALKGQRARLVDPPHHMVNGSAQPIESNAVCCLVWHLMSNGERVR